MQLLQAQADSIYVGATILPREYVLERFKDPMGWTPQLPEYDPKKWPPPPPPPEKTAGAPAAPGETPNTEGANAPGQKPPDPTSIGTSEGSAAGTSVEGYNPGRSASME